MSSFIWYIPYTQPFTNKLNLPQRMWREEEGNAIKLYEIIILKDVYEKSVIPDTLQV